MRDEMGLHNDAGNLVEPSPLFDALRSGVRQPDGTVIVDRGDGTGTRTTYDEHGQVTATEELTGLPIPEPVAEPTDPVALLVSALRDPLADLTAFSASTTVRTAILNQRAALDALLELYR